MKRYFKSIRRWSLTLVTLFFFVAALPGCNDPGVKNLEMRDQKIESDVEQELQHSRNASKLESDPASAPPAQAADMEAERRELDRRIESGEWQSLFH